MSAEETPWSRTLLTSRAGVVELANSLDRYERIGLDTESSGPNLYAKASGKGSMLNVHRSTLTGMSIALPDRRSFYLPLSHKRGSENAPLGAYALLLDALRRYRGTVWAHNLDHEIHALARGPLPAIDLLLDLEDAARGNPVGCPVWRCSMVMSWVAGASRRDMYGLKSLAKELFGRERPDFLETTNGLDFSQLRPKDGLDYACYDAEDALEIVERVLPGLVEDERKHRWFEEVETPFVWLVNAMERAGMLFDPDAHERTIHYLKEKRAALWPVWERLCEEAGTPGISPFAPQQLQALFGEGKPWPTKGWERTDSGKGWSTSKKHLERWLESVDPSSLGARMARAKIELNAAGKLLGTYGEKLHGMAGEHADGRIRDSFRQANVRTGRLSSSLLLLVPKHSEDGKRIRESFVPAGGRRFLAGDLKAAELRMIAHYARYGALFDTFTSGDGDPHRATGDALGRSRAIGKLSNFAMIYGSGPGNISEAAKIPLEEAKSILEQLKVDMAAEISALDRAEESGLSNGYVRTFGGRTRRIGLGWALARKRKLYRAGKRWDDEDGQYRAACRRVGREKRVSRNTPIQGSVADIMKICALRYWRAADPARSAVVLQIHDDLVTETDEDYLEEAKEIMHESMTKAVDLRVPLEVDIREGARWSEAS